MRPRHAVLMSSLAALAPAVLLIPYALVMAGGVSGARRILFAFLLIQTTYVLVGGVCLGAHVSTKHAKQLLYFASLSAAGCLFAVLVFGVDLASLARAQPAVLGTLFLGWGIGRASRALCGRNGSALALGMLLAATFSAGLLPLSHVAPLLESWPRVAELVLSANPFVAVTNAAAFDLIRSPVLYDVLTLSDYRFTYPAPWLPPVSLSAIGLGLVLLGNGVERGTRRVCSDSSLREVTP